MRAAEILSRGIETRKNDDKTFSYNGKPDFTPESPTLKTFGPTGPYSRPRSKASLNNSYT